MFDVYFYSIAAVLVVSLISLVGVFTLGIAHKSLRRFLIFLISFSAGALLGDAFIHLLPEIVEEYGFSSQISLLVLLGIALFFVLEKFIHWEHCHGHVLEEGHIHSFAYMNLIGDGFHNFLDGVIIASSFLINVPAGIATTIAVALHEIPQEIGDFGVLLHGGFSKGKALLINFASALMAVVGAIVALLIGGYIGNIELFLVPIAAGGFIYIAASDLIPELHKHSNGKAINSILQLVMFILGIVAMYLLLFLE